MMIEKRTSKKLAKLVAGTLTKQLRNEANTTSCMFVYQPKAPKELSKFKK